MEWITEFVLPHWPFALVVCVLWLIGHFMEKSVFTVARIAENHPSRKPERSRAEKFHHWFFYWMRESMELHSTFTGFGIGLLWHNPEHASPAWPWWADAGYFGFAGFVGLFGWLIIVKVLGRVGVNAESIRLPGETKPPDDPS